MSKPFVEVFPNLKLDKQVKDQIEHVDVEKVTTNSRKDFLRIYIACNYLIQKEIILKVEKQIKTQLFQKNDITIKIYEKFTLSSQYNPQNLLDIYKESILMELREYDHIIYNAFKGADISFSGEDRMELTVPDSVLIRGKSEELIRILKKFLTNDVD